MDSRFSRNNLEDFLLYYSYYYPSRRLNSEKKAVYQFILDKFSSDLKMEVCFDSIRVGLNKVGYCVIGDLDKAQNIYIAPLDTSKITHLPNYRIYPLCEEKGNKVNALADCLDTFIVFIGIAAVYYICRNFIDSNIVIGLIATAFVVIWNFLQTNRFTFSSSSAMAFISTIAANHDDKKTAYVFLDNCADSYFGLKMFIVRHKSVCQKAKRLIYFDHLASGEKLIWASRKKRNVKFSDLQVEDVVLTGSYPACFETVTDLTILFTAEQEDGEYVVHNVRSAKDKKIDVDRLKALLKELS